MKELPAGSRETEDERQTRERAFQAKLAGLLGVWTDCRKRACIRARACRGRDPRACVLRVAATIPPQGKAMLRRALIELAARKRAEEDAGAPR